MPKISYYGLFTFCAKGKTPKYVLSAQAGFYPPMEQLQGKDGKVSLYLMESKASGHTKDNTPPMRLQAAKSLNLTGLKDYFIDGKISGFAYGYPPDTPTYGTAKPRPNPLYEHKQDAFLFIVDKYEQGAAPKYFELIVLDNAKVLAAAYCKQLIMGGFDEQLKQLRAQAEAAQV